MSFRSTIPAATVCALVLAGTAAATAPPVGPLPPGPVTTVSATAGSYVSLVLPKGAQGRSWRQARPFDQGVAREVSEGDVGKYVVIVFRTVRPGTTKVLYGLTRGETKKAFASATLLVHVR
jgi:hypothetical protein